MYCALNTKFDVCNHMRMITLNMFLLGPRPPSFYRFVLRARGTTSGSLRERRPPGRRLRITPRAKPGGPPPDRSDQPPGHRLRITRREPPPSPPPTHHHHVRTELKRSLPDHCRAENRVAPCEYRLRPTPCVEPIICRWRVRQSQ